MYIKLEYLLARWRYLLACEKVIANNTAKRICLPNKMPPISPKETGILFLVSTRSKNVYNEINAIDVSNPVENKSPPL
jgi:hypothetical protein